VIAKSLFRSAGLLFLLTAPGMCFASTLYGIQFSSGTGFFGVNQIHGALAMIGDTGSPATGDLTSDLSSTIWSVDMVQHLLLSIDPSNGAVLSAVPLASASGSPVSIVSLAWNPVTQMLYGNTSMGFGNSGPEELYRINPATGTATLVGAIGFNAVFALGFDNSGVLYGISPWQLLTISTTTGAGTLTAPVTLSAAFDLAFRPGDNTMFVADSGTNSLYTMNPTSGAATLVGAYGSSTNVVGLAFLGTPEPGTIGLLLAGLGLLISVRRASGLPLT
jgi:hypothetical protein